jgi:hypothetical protein
MYEQVQREAQAAEVRKEAQRHEENMKHNVDLRGQISTNIEKRERDRQQFLEDGAKQRYFSPPSPGSPAPI